MIRHGIIYLIAVLSIGCASIAERQNNIVSEYLSINSDINSPFREAMKSGKVIRGMTAEQVFIASGEKARRYKDYSIWVVHEDGTLHLPPYVIRPGTPTALIFNNTTQYDTATPQLFVVYMDADNKVLRVERGTGNLTHIE